MVGEKFKAIRKAKGLTLEGAAKMLGLTAPRPKGRGFPIHRIEPIRRTPE